jgi:Family of unknown function (DUF6152)
MKIQLRYAAPAAAVLTLAFVGGAAAHHSISMFDISKAIWLEGKVVRYAPIAPHAMIAVEVTGDDGEAEKWVVEGPNPARLERVLNLNGLSAAEDFLKAGASIRVCGFALKNQWKPERMYPDSVWSSTRFVHGQVLVMPDGHLQSWGPYGRLENCVRPNDTTQSWADFLNADPLARAFWCGGLSAYQSQFATAPSAAFVDEVGGEIDEPCGE